MTLAECKAKIDVGLHKRRIAEGITLDSPSVLKLFVERRLHRETVKQLVATEACLENAPAILLLQRALDCFSISQSLGHYPDGGENRGNLEDAYDVLQDIAKFLGEEIHD